MDRLFSAWQLWALLSAIFAALTAIFAKIGVQGINSDFATFIRTFVIICVLGAIILRQSNGNRSARFRAVHMLFLVLSGLATGASWLCYFRALKLGDAASPETDQVCLDATGATWTCGISALNALVSYSAGRSWLCSLQEAPDRYGRRIGTCTIGNVDIQAWMATNGWALAYRKYSAAYIGDETQAKAARRGLWTGAFHAPWDWRHHTCKTEILDAYSVPIDAAAKLCPAEDAPPNPNCTIKGNLRSKGGCIFHMPGDGSYFKLTMKKSGHRWFCSTEEAVAAGCRRAHR